MKNSIDSDLKFLSNCNNDQLQLLCDMLTYDPKDGKKRYTETLTQRASYLSYYPSEMKKMLPAVIDEYQKFGGNTIANMLRGHGVSYRVILRDVCKALDMKCSDADSVETMEIALLKRTAQKLAESLSEEDASIEVLKNDIIRFCNNELDCPDRVIGVLLLSFAPKLTQMGLSIVYTSVGRGLIARLPLGPAFWIVGGVWTLFDVASPAFRVTIPATIIIACLRRVYGKTTEELGLTVC